MAYLAGLGEILRIRIGDVLGDDLAQVVFVVRHDDGLAAQLLPEERLPHDPLQNFTTNADVELHVRVYLVQFAGRGSNAVLRDAQ